MRMLRVLPLLLGLSVALPLGASELRAEGPKDKAATKEKAKEKPKAKETDSERRARLRLQRNQRILSRDELEAAMAPHVPAIGDCYKRHTAKQKDVSGKLSLEMLIRPAGTLQKLWVHAPTVEGDELDKCIHELSKMWRFPKKPGFTNAVVPFFFQKTDAKGVGPLESCWSAKGCPDKQRHKRKQGK